MPKKLIQVYVDDNQYHYIAKKAEETKRSRASIIREAIDDYKKNELRKDGGKLTVQETVEKYLLEKEARMGRKYTLHEG